MSAIAYIFNCSKCHTAFEGPEARQDAYGAFVMRTDPSDDAAWLDAIDDEVFAESYEYVKANPRVAAIDAQRVGTLQQSVFSVVCDRNEKGEAYQIGLLPKCPSCGSRDMRSWEPITPPREWPLPNVSHDAWNRSARSERKALIDRTVAKLLP